NLQRQIIHGSADVRRPKVESAGDAVTALNPHVRFVAYPIRLSASNADGLLSDYDVVADGSDNFDTRYALSDACFYARKPLVTATLNQFDGSLTTLRPFDTDPEGLPNPTWRCLFPEQPAPGLIPTCAEAGILGPVAGVLGSMMALEVIREILGGFFPGDRGLVGTQLLVDLRGLRFDRIGYGWDPDNPLNGRAVTAAQQS
ncbi:MAG: HesA/MoeB/ThiF family protein, partial [Beijerinckiaceae bacterium]